MNELVPFFCHFCESLAYDLTVLKEHMGTHAKSKASEKQAAKCNLCSKTYKRKEKLNVHIKSVHKGIRHICDQCGTSHKTKNGLRSHVLIVHKNQKRYRYKSYQCTECHKLFTKIFTNCKDHIKTCEKCGYTTNFQGHLKKHQGSLYCDPSRSHKKIMCGKCSNTFTTEKYMKKHELCHTNGKPHKCPDCGVGFTERFNMKRHKKKNNCKGVNNFIV